MVILTDEVVKMLKEIMDIFYLEKDLDVRMRYADQLAGSLDMALLVGENNATQSQLVPPILNAPYYVATPPALDPPYIFTCGTQNKKNKQE